MALSSSTSYREHTVTSVAQATYAYNYRILAATDMAVYFKPSSSSSTETQMTYTTHFSVTDAGQDSGGSVILTAAATALTGYAVNSVLRLQRETDFTQETDYVENDTFPAQTHEDALDKVTMMAQQLSRTNSKYLWIDEEFSTTTITTVERVAGKYLKWNASGSGVAAETIISDSLNSYWASLTSNTNSDATVRASIGVPGLATDSTITGYWHFTNATVEFSTVSATYLAGAGVDNFQVKTTSATVVGQIGSSGLRCYETDGTNTFWASPARVEAKTAWATSYFSITTNALTLSDVSSGTYLEANATRVLAIKASFTNGSFTTIQSTTCKGTTASFTRSKNVDQSFISKMRPQYSTAATYEVEAGSIVIAGVPYVKANSSLYACAATKLYTTYLYATATASGFALVTSNITKSNTAPSWNGTYAGWYNGASRCIGHVYNEATSTISPFAMVGDKYMFKNAQTLVSAATASNGTVYNQTVSVLGPQVEGLTCEVACRTSHGGGANWTGGDKWVSVIVTETYDNYTAAADIRANGSIVSDQKGEDSAGSSMGGRVYALTDSSGDIRLMVATTRNNGSEVSVHFRQKSLIYGMGLRRS